MVLVKDTSIHVKCMDWGACARCADSHQTQWGPLWSELLLCVSTRPSLRSPQGVGDRPVGDNKTHMDAALPCEGVFFL